MSHTELDFHKYTLLPTYYANFLSMTCFLYAWYTVKDKSRLSASVKDVDFRTSKLSAHTFHR